MIPGGRYHQHKIQGFWDGAPMDMDQNEHPKWMVLLDLKHEQLLGLRSEHAPHKTSSLN